jgi:hypothetical protein
MAPTIDPNKSAAMSIECASPTKGKANSKSKTNAGATQQPSVNATPDFTLERAAKATAPGKRIYAAIKIAMPMAGA